jgi:hypothetical protein
MSIQLENTSLHAFTPLSAMHSTRVSPVLPDASMDLPCDSERVLRAIAREGQKQYAQQQQRADVATNVDTTGTRRGLQLQHGERLPSPSQAKDKVNMSTVSLFVSTTFGLMAVLGRHQGLCNGRDVRM